MAGRTDFFFRQKVTEAELDLAFELLELADRNLAADIGVYGIISGAEPAPHSPVPNLTIDLTAPARAYDNLGQRIFFGTGQVVDCSVDLTGIPTEVPVAVQERWLGLFLRFDRLLSDPRTDGNSQQVFFRRDESFEVVVRQGPLGPVGGASKVPLMPDELLVCDVLRKNGQTQILAPDIDVSRRQAFIFAQGDAVEVVSGLWSILAPAVNTVQAALDEVDAELAGHFGGSARRHPASDIDYTPHGFVAADDVQTAIDEVVDDLSTSTAGNPGAQRVGADAVSGTPHALTASNVDSHLSQILGWLNAHLAATSGAHNASAIAAAVHSYIAGTTVQAQLQEIVSDLALQTAGSAGASRIGADAVSGSPSSLAAGTVDSQLADLLGDINDHVSDASDAHDASAISVADSGGNLTASNVETALAEIVDAFEGDHYRGNEGSAGQHRAIHQPDFGSGRVLLWEARGNGSVSGRLRVYADSDTVWFTINAAWNGSAWERDSTSYFSGGMRFSREDFVLFHENTFAATFTDWTRTWTLPMSSTVNSAFEMTGSTREVGRLGYESHNTYNATRNMAVGGANTFRSRFPATPSSITFSETSSANTDGPPSVWDADRDGFGFFDYVNVAANTTLYWFGTYTAVA
ncbi:MAG: hypothetical protein ACOY3Y_13295 [Acidobacteriota bacterium]